MFVSFEHRGCGHVIAARREVSPVYPVTTVGVGGRQLEENVGRATSMLVVENPRKVKL